jgi:hypothetical protein
MSLRRSLANKGTKSRHVVVTDTACPAVPWFLKCRCLKRRRLQHRKL